MRISSLHKISLKKSEGIPDVSNKGIVFLKYYRLNMCISTFTLYQNNFYPFEAVSKIQELLASIEYVDEADLFSKSLKIEPRY